MKSSYIIYNDNSAHNHDSFLMKEDEVLLDAVMDGVTTDNGGFASNTVKNILEKEKITDKENFKSALQKANKKVYLEGATTFSGGIYINGTLYLITIGDSPVYLLRDEKIYLLNKMDSSYFISALLTNAVGNYEEISTHDYEIKIQKGDKLIYCTDGLSDNINEKELYDTLTNKTVEKSKESLDKLISTKRNNNKGNIYNFFKEDDITAIIRYF